MSRPRNARGLLLFSLDVLVYFSTNFHLFPCLCSMDREFLMVSDHVLFNLIIPCSPATESPQIPSPRYRVTKYSLSLGRGLG